MSPPSEEAGAGSTLKSANGTQDRWTPETVLSTLQQRPQTQGTSPLPFFHILERLKTNKREGWRRFTIDNGESIADHMYRMAILTMLAPPSLSSRLDIPHCTKMALIHDMAESLVGDITPVDKVPKSEKSRREAETMDYLTDDLLGKVGGGLAGMDIRAVWQEYEDSQTLESKFVHDVDKVELLLQMVEYERSAHEGGKAGETPLDLGEFSWVAKKVVLPECQEWCVQILSERAEHWKALGVTPKGEKITQEEHNDREQYYG